MPSWIPTILGAIALALASGLVGWVWALWRDHHALRVKIAEEYPRNHTIDNLKEEIKELRYIVWKIAEKLDVPVLRRD